MHPLIKQNWIAVWPHGAQTPSEETLNIKVLSRRYVYLLTLVLKFQARLPNSAHETQLFTLLERRQLR